MGPRVGHGDDAAHRGADQRESREAELVDDRGEIADLVTVLIRAGGRPGALSVTAHVHRDEVVAIVEAPRERVEGLRARRVAVDAHDRRRAGIAPVEIVHAQSVDVESPDSRAPAGLSCPERSTKRYRVTGPSRAGCRACRAPTGSAGAPDDSRPRCALAESGRRRSPRSRCRGRASSSRWAPAGKRLDRANRAPAGSSLDR